MIIYIVQQGDTIESIANAYGIPVVRLIQDNSLKNSNNLVPGQTIVITFPEQTHIVQEGDTLGTIADTYNVPIMQLLRNNPNLTVTNNLYVGETIIIKYSTGRKILVNGLAYPFIPIDTLKKTLPSLTYLSIYNYKADRLGQIIAYDDDTSIIQLAKDYGVVPLMMIASLTSRGEPDLDVGYELLLNEEYLNINIQNTVNIMKEKGYSGVNMVFSYLNPSTQELYLKLITTVSEAMRAEGFLYFITINPSIDSVDDIAGVDYSGIDPLIDGIALSKFVWGSNASAPAPVSSNYFITEFVKYLLNYFPSYKIKIAVPVMGYEWELPYVEGRTVANSLSIDSALSLAYEVGATIYFDEVSQTPYFEYIDYEFVNPIYHIVWFTDARTINAALKVISDYELNGLGIWSIMIYYGQLWLILNSQYEVVKLIPDIFQQ